MKNSQVPVASKEGLVVQETSDEVLIYDLSTNKAHCLNQTAAFIWKSCDGSASVSEITKRFENETGVPVGEDLVWLAIDQLKDKKLLETQIPSNFIGKSRREAIKRIGLATVVALPVIASLTAPTSVMASQSCACVTPGDCGSQTACPSTTNCNGSGVCAPGFADARKKS